MHDGSLVSFRRFDTDGARGVRDMVAVLYSDAYAESITGDDPFETVEAFLERFDAYTSRAGFDLVIAYDGAGRPVGQAFGWALEPPDGGWWRHLVTPDPELAEEDGKRTFALSEIMVRRTHTGRGIGRALHDELLDGRVESRAVLLVRPDNSRAYGAYTRWGWRQVAQLQGGWAHAPLMDVLRLDLPRLSPRTLG